MANRGTDNITSHVFSGAALVQWYRWAQTQARQHQVPLGEVDWLLEAVTTVERLELRLGTVGDRPAIQSRFDLDTLTQCWERRCSDRVPVQYLAEFTTWRNLELRVTPAVLIPRPETELLVDLVYGEIQKNFAETAPTEIAMADLGTGSGAIALALAELLPAATVYGIDCSGAAIAIATQNAQQNTKHNGPQNCSSPLPKTEDTQNNPARRPVQFLQGSWLSPLGSPCGQLTAIVSNPPYIPSATVLTLQPEVVHHEPHLALDGGADGLDDIRHLIDRGAPYLCPGGIWAVEHMAGQGKMIADLLAASNHYSGITMHRDLAGRDRFVLAQRRL